MPRQQFVSSQSADWVDWSAPSPRCCGGCGLQQESCKDLSSSLKSVRGHGWERRVPGCATRMCHACLKTHQRSDTADPTCSSELGSQLARLRFVLCRVWGTTTHKCGQRNARWQGDGGRAEEAAKPIREELRGGAGGEQQLGCPKSTLPGCGSGRRVPAPASPARGTAGAGVTAQPGWARARPSAPPCPSAAAEALPGVGAAAWEVAAMGPRRAGSVARREPACPSLPEGSSYPELVEPPLETKFVLSLFLILLLIIFS